MEVDHTLTESADSCRKVEEKNDAVGVVNNIQHNNAPPFKLYERQSQQDELIDTYQRCIGGSSSSSSSSSSLSKELLMINGSSGTGKTALANSFRGHVEKQDDAIWIQGKFEQIHRAKPYAPILAALSELVTQLELRGTETKRRFHEAVAGRMDAEDQMWLISIVPSLFHVLTPPSDDDDTTTRSNVNNPPILISGAVARNQFQRVIPILLTCVCSAVKVPVVLFLDDLQWSDSSSLQLLRDLASDGQTPSLVVLGAYRGDEVAVDNLLSITLRQIEDQDKVKIITVCVTNLCIGAVQEFVADALELPIAVVQPLAEIVFQESQGNVFYMGQFMKTLQESGFLYRQAGTKQWKWDEEQIRPRYNDVLLLLSAALRKLPEHVQHVLQVAACLGTKFKEHHLQIVISSEVEPALAAAEDKDILFVDNDSGFCNWIHDRWQQAAYNLIPEASRSQFHLQIGRMLWNELPTETQGRDNNNHLFLIVNQVMKGSELITDDDERQIASILCLQAGEMAAKASALDAAAVYLNHGLDLLVRRHWRDQYELSMRLYNAAAEMEYCCGRFEKVMKHTDEVLLNARTFEDRLQAYTTQVYAIGSKGNVRKSIDLGLTVLKKLGVCFPRRAKIWHVGIAFMKTKQLLNGKSDSDILNLPLISDPHKVAAMNLMNLLFHYAKMSDFNLCSLLANQMIRTTLKEGIVGASCAPCFSFYGSFICWMGDVDEGVRLAQLSLMILKKFNTKEWVPRVAAPVFAIVLPWRVPLRECLPGLYDAYRKGYQSGDFEIASVTGIFYSMAFLLCGHPLNQVYSEMSSFSEQLKKFGHDDKTLQCKIIIEFVRCLMVGGDIPATGTNYIDSKKAAPTDQDKVQENMVSLQVAFWKFVVSFFRGDYATVIQINKRFGLRRRMGPPCIHAAFRTFSCLASLSLPYHARVKMRMIRQNHRTLERWATRCPENFGNKVCLIEAEVARVKEKYDQARVKYDESIHLAEKEGNVMEQALACERAGLSFHECGKSTTAIEYFEQAQRLYQEWGSTFKMDQLKGYIRLERLNLKRQK